MERKILSIIQGIDKDNQRRFQLHLWQYSNGNLNQSTVFSVFTGLRIENLQLLGICRLVMNMEVLVC